CACVHHGGDEHTYGTASRNHHADLLRVARKDRVSRERYAKPAAQPLMCGIAGFVGCGDERHLISMTNSMVHRGPDGSGTYVDHTNAVFLGHRRLSILDLQGGEQPMWNEDGQVGVIFNGEIYNHLELRKVLVANGHRFKSDHSDTEVLVHGYEQW